MARFEGDPQVLTRIGLEPFEQLDVHVRHPTRGVNEALARGIFANGLK
jgi:hypothetical protein